MFNIRITEINLIPFLIFLSFLLLAIKADIASAIPEMVGISAFIVMLLATLQLSSTHFNLYTDPYTHKKELSAKFILTFAILIRLMFLLQSPTLSDDIYRYCLDGIMLIHSQNPYSYAPDQISAVMHTSAIHNIYSEISSLLRLVNHPEFTTIYPPVAQIVFAFGAFMGTTCIFIGKIVGISLDMTFIVISIKFTLIIMDTLSCLLIIKILYKIKLPTYHAIIYAWHPLPILEIASSGHIDGAAIFFMLMAIYLAIHSGTTKANSWNGLMLGKIFSVRFSRILMVILSGVFIGLSILTKWMPLIFLPCWLFLMQSGRTKVIATISCITTITIFINPFYPNIINSLGTLNQYLQNWEFAGFFFRIIRNFIQNYTNQPGNITRSIIIVVFIFLYSIIFLRCLKNSNNSRLNVVIDSLFKIALIWIILTPTLYPWYALYLVALLPFTINNNFNTAGITLSWSVFLSYKVLILYKLTGEWLEVEDTITPLMIIAAPVATLILEIYMSFRAREISRADLA